jgi:hypothetical protein
MSGGARPGESNKEQLSFCPPSRPNLVRKEVDRPERAAQLILDSFWAEEPVAEPDPLDTPNLWVSFEAANQRSGDSFRGIPRDWRFGRRDGREVKRLLDRDGVHLRVWSLVCEVL